MASRAAAARLVVLGYRARRSWAPVRCQSAPGTVSTCGTAIVDATRTPIYEPLRRDDVADLPDQLRLRDRADDLLLHLAAREDDQVRDPADTVARRRLRVVVDV